jgi:adenylate cyclase
MPDEGFKRKLTSILSADAVGYSRLMEDDEEATVRTLTSYREVIATLIKQHNGMVVDSPGDNLLAEFVSVVDAVQCAVSVQNEINARNEDLPENRKMQFRIGINLGDVIQEGERIYGDGVNIAARLEGLADPGGICISKTAFDQIERKLPYGYEFIGDQTVKNISKPVGAYRVMLEPRVTVAGEPEEEKPAPVRRIPILVGVALVLVLAIAVGVWQFYARRPSVEPASVEKMAYPLPDKPSIAVLPFVNMSDDPEQEYFSNGLTDEIITTLSKIPRIFVIARESVFSYKTQKAQINKVSRELGVRYILEGSVRKSQNRLRISAQLIDGITGQSLWAERYEKTIGEIFAIQDEITLSILRALQVNLSEGEQARLIGKKTNNLDAYLKAIQAQEQFFQMNRQGSTRAKELAKESINLDPKYAFPYTTLANAHMLDVWFKFSESPGESMKLAINAAEKALFLDDSDPAIYSALSNLYVMQQQYDKAIMAARKAIELSPGGARAHVSMGYALLFSSKFKDAIPYFEQAIRLNPYPPGLYFRSLAAAYRFAGRYDESLITYKKALNLNPGDLFCHLGLTSLYVLMGRMEDSKLQASEVIRLYPNFSLEYYAKTLTLEDQSVVTEMIETLRKAGLN